MLLDVQNLEVRYGRTRALRSATIKVEDGEIVTVLGANGAGKTSLLRALQGVVRPAGGKISFRGCELTNSSPAARVRAGMMLVPEGRQIFVSMTVHENLLMGAYLRRNADVAGDIEAIYARFPNLAARRDMQASVLSGGEQQMLAIGRALVGRPGLMMLDEPSLGLSPLYVSRLFDLIVELNKSGIGILLVEQNTSMALAVASRGYVLELGKVVLDDKAATLASDKSLTDAYLGGARSSAFSPAPS